MNTKPEYDKLLGALVGLVRATEGNEDLITDRTDALVLKALQADPNGTDTEAIASLLTRIAEEKRRLIPNCFCCEARCGRADDYNVSALYSAPDDVREAKLGILANLRRLASAVNNATALSDTILNTVYNAIFYIGLDLGKEDLESMEAETESALSRLSEA